MGRPVKQSARKSSPSHSSLPDPATELAAARSSMTPLQEIAAERERQINEKGYDQDHDDSLIEGELAAAAACYSARAAGHDHIFQQDSGTHYDKPFVTFSDIWPCEAEYDNRELNNSHRLLVVAGAFIVAELERLNRLAAFSERQKLDRKKFVTKKK